MSIYNTTTKTAQDVIKRVQRTFGDEAGVQIRTDDLFNWINDGQREIVRDNEVLRNIASAPLVPGQKNYPLSAIPILSIQSVRIGDKALKYLNFQSAEDKLGGISDSPGDPEYWYNFTGDLSLFPVPTSAVSGSLSIYYTGSPTDVSNLGDKLAIPDTYFNALVQYVLSQAHELDEDYNAAGQKRNDFNDSLMRLSEKESYSNNDAYPVITISPEDM